ncbi:hypothetical protein WKN59_000226 [Escherichia coli]|uniref:Protein YmgK n=9 Tax=Enterobacteriaceae TaxID=543 RepID=YMGK_ECOLI|nr:MULTISPECIES: protein YmgK [Gammaproteobacteria]YP_009518766.1 protein YmgK [Escherichia coli str. K-12 substr. MG1655]P0DPN8.1 RecName: Full=Protein YmgK [Escherichia coli K-12]EHQ5436588.1 hypothetical protein [Escherichia coli O168]EHT2176947.1 hypothetical protein [Escherichia coli O116]EHW0744832.1 hypothetical protein [Escherichia coli O48]EHY1577094.1 hypothetical protein [Escherichia coli O8]EHY1704127.1 hypothetical protein [Escherichia coli O21]EIA9672981.1 hypothetical protein
MFSKLAQSSIKAMF